MNLSLDQLHPLVLNAGLAIHNADWNWRDVISPFFRLYFVTEGTAQIELPTGLYQLKPKHMYLIPAFTKHNNICDSHFCHYYMHIYEENLKQNVLKNKQRAFYDKVESRGIVYQLLAHFIKRAQEKSKNGDERLEKALAYIHNHINENLNINELAELTCLSKAHFIRLFKQEVKTTPLQYINRRKMEMAQLTLVTSDTPVKDIAFALGFEDYSYFNRLFKKMVGTTPQEYRDSYH